jgi:hypothetical protein
MSGFEDFVGDLFLSSCHVCDSLGDFYMHVVLRPIEDVTSIS